MLGVAAIPSRQTDQARDRTTSMACACYWGCGTRSNKIVYGITLLLLIAGVALAVAGACASQLQGKRAKLGS